VFSDFFLNRCLLESARSFGFQPYERISNKGKKKGGGIINVSNENIEGVWEFASDARATVESLQDCRPYTYRAWDLGEEKDKDVQKFPLNRGDNKPRRCEQHF